MLTAQPARFIRKHKRFVFLGMELHVSLSLSLEKRLDGTKMKRAVLSLDRPGDSYERNSRNLAYLQVHFG
jgi:hypothetical protein